MSPAERIHVELIRSRRDDLKLAALIILAEPKRITKPILRFLVDDVKCMEQHEQRVDRWLARAGVCPTLTGPEIHPKHRERLAGLLYRVYQGADW